MRGLIDAMSSLGQKEEVAFSFVPLTADVEATLANLTPEVDAVSGIPPTVAIQQRISQASRRSTSGLSSILIYCLT